MSRQVTLPSGAELVVNIAPFKDAKALFQAMAKEWKAVVTLGDLSDSNVMAGMFMSAFSSPDVERALWPCLVRSTYNSQKIVPETFEAEDSRQDFISCCMEVTSDNVVPFMKGLFSGSVTPSSTQGGNQQ